MQWFQPVESSLRITLRCLCFVLSPALLVCLLRSAFFYRITAISRFLLYNESSVASTVVIKNTGTLACRVSQEIMIPNSKVAVESVQSRLGVGEIGNFLARAAQIFEQKPFKPHLVFTNGHAQTL